MLSVIFLQNVLASKTFLHQSIQKKFLIETHYLCILQQKDLDPCFLQQMIDMGGIERPFHLRSSGISVLQNLSSYSILYSLHKQRTHCDQTHCAQTHCAHTNCAQTAHCAQTTHSAFMHHVMHHVIHNVMYHVIHNDMLCIMVCIALCII